MRQGNPIIGAPVQEALHGCQDGTMAQQGALPTQHMCERPLSRELHAYRSLRLLALGSPVMPLVWTIVQVSSSAQDAGGEGCSAPSFATS